MNKKVTLSLLSATVFASMAASAFAAPTQGVYMGGSVDKFYKLDDLFNLSAAAKKQFVVDMNAANPDLDFKNLVFVDFDGKGAKFSEILAAGTLPKAKRDLTKADFEGSYVTVNLDGSNGVSYDPRNDAVDVPTGDLKVESVSAISTTILPSADVAADFKLALEYKDKDGKAIPAANLPADLNVSFADNLGVFKTDGTLADKAKIPAAGNSITVVATVTSESQSLNKSVEFKVNVVAKTAWKEVKEAKLVANTDVDVNTAVVGDAIKLVPTVAVQNDGTELKDTTAPTHWGTNVKSVVSSDITKLAVAANGTAIDVTPISEGTATVTVTLNSGATFEKTITVKEAARKATTAVAETVKLSSTVSTGNIKVTVKDQYGDPVKNATIYGYPTKTGASALVTVNSAATDAKGEASLAVSATQNATTGSDTVKLSTSNDATAAGIGNVTVEFAKAGDVASYALRISSASESKDATIDTYKSDDNDLELEFIGLDANGVVAAIYNQNDVGSKYTVSSSDNTIATAAIDANGKIDVAAVKAGSATITVKEGNIVRATFNVTVTDSTPVVGSLSAKADAKIYVNSGKADNTDDVTIVGKETATPTYYSQQTIANLVEVKNGEKTFDLSYNNGAFDVKDGANVVATLKLFSSDTTNLPLDVDGATLKPADALTESSSASVIFKLTQGTTVVGTVAIPVVFDETAPAAPTVNAIDDNDVKITGTAEAGSTVEAFDGQTSLGTAVADNDGNYSIDLQSAVAAGKTVTVKATDLANNVSQGKDVTVTDVTAPSMADTYPKATPGAAGSKEVTVAVKSNEGGKAYLVALANDATAPTAAQVKAGKDADDADVANKATVDLTADTEATHKFTLAADATDYDVFIVLEDAAGNLTAVAKLDVTTPAAQ